MVCARADLSRLVVTHCGIDAEVRGDLLVALDRFEWQVGVTNYVHVKRDVLVEPPSA